MVSMGSQWRQEFQDDLDLHNLGARLLRWSVSIGGVAHNYGWTISQQQSAEIMAFVERHQYVAGTNGSPTVGWLVFWHNKSGTSFGCMDCDCHATTYYNVQYPIAGNAIAEILRIFRQMRRG